MLTTIFIPKWLRYGLVLMILSQASVNLLEVVQVLRYQWRSSIASPQALAPAETPQHCEEPEDRAARLADEREAHQQ